MAASIRSLKPLTRTRQRSPLILAVDDEASLRRVLSFTLARLGYRVETAESGEEALERIEGAPVDLVLLDLMLPGIDGLAVLRRARRLIPDLPVVVLTADGSVENAVEAMKLGAQDFLTKPFEMERLAIAVRNALEISHLSRQIRELRTQLGDRYSMDEIIGARGGLREAVGLIEKVIPTDLTVLIEGDSGTGKELFARAIHHEGPRKNGPFVAINCAALPESLLESELFGHEKGSFTGAEKMHTGKFEAADGGTLFLDEVGELSPSVQAKLLRTIQERTVTRVGGNRPIPVDSRIICATNRDLSALVKEGRFREDLYYRLSVYPVSLPPLRERKEDLPDLVRHILRETRHDRPVAVHPGAMELLEAYSWPGNVRELQNALRRAVVLADEGPILPEHLPPCVQASLGDTLAPMPSAEMQVIGRSTLPGPDPLGEKSDRVVSLDEMERDHILRAIESTRGNLSHAARMLSIGRTTLYRKLQKYGIQG